MSRSRLIRIPRLLAGLTALFYGLFAFDALTGTSGFWNGAVAIGMHLLPSALVLGALAVAWRHEVIGGLLFIALGMAYALVTGARSHPDWVVVIAGPLWLIGLLFLVGHSARTPSTSV